MKKYQSFYWFINHKPDKNTPWVDDRGLNVGELPWKEIKLKDGNSRWYLHSFSWFQPDLNWNNPEVRKEMAKVANYWTKEGVKGFRFDAIPLIGKHTHNPLTLPDPLRLKKFLSEFRNKTYRNEKEFVTIGELAQSSEYTENSKQLTRIASQVFTTAYLPINTLYRFPREESDKREKDNKHATIPGGHPHSYNRPFPWEVWNIRYSFELFKYQEYGIQALLYLWRNHTATLEKGLDESYLST